MDRLRRDDIERARATPPEERARQALEAMGTGIRLKRAALRARNAGATDEEIERHPGAMAPTAVKDSGPADALLRAAGELDRRGQPFALVGGLGVSIRGEVRFTRDVDLAIAVSGDAETEALVLSLGTSGYTVVAVVEQEAMKSLARTQEKPSFGARIPSPPPKPSNQGRLPKFILALTLAGCRAAVAPARASAIPVEPPSSIAVPTAPTSDELARAPDCVRVVAEARKDLQRSGNTSAASSNSLLRKVGALALSTVLDLHLPWDAPLRVGVRTSWPLSEERIAALQKAGLTIDRALLGPSTAFGTVTASNIACVANLDFVTYVEQEPEVSTNGR